jgi:lysophospholipase L1-like esterase
MATLQHRLFPFGRAARGGAFGRAARCVALAAPMLVLGGGCAGDTVGDTTGAGGAGTGGGAVDGGAAGTGGGPGAGGSAVGGGGAVGSPDAGGGAAGAGGVTGNAGAGGRGGSGGSSGAAGRGGSSGTGGAAGNSGGSGGAAGGGRGGNSGTGGRGGAGGSAGGAGGAGGALPSITVWLAGDSTVADGSAPCPIGWGASFQTLFGSRATVVNDAIAGRSVRTWLYSVQSTMDSTGECVLDTNADGTPVLQSRWQAMLNGTNGTNGMKSGDYLLIQFGINDSDSACPRHVGINAFKASYGMMAQAATDRGAHPIFITPTSSISCSGTKAVATRGSYVPATKDAGTQYAVPVIDLNAATVSLYNAMSFCPVPGGDVSASTTGPVGDFFCDDHTHYSATGAPQIAALVAQAVRAQGLPLAAYLK